MTVRYEDLEQVQWLKTCLEAVNTNIEESGGDRYHQNTVSLQPYTSKGHTMGVQVEVPTELWTSFLGLRKAELTQKLTDLGVLMPEQVEAHQIPEPPVHSTPIAHEPRAAAPFPGPPKRDDSSLDDDIPL